MICSDRWSAYQAVPLAQRQICWAHLKRDFQAMVDRGGAGAAVGEELLFHTDVLFTLWYKVRDGTRGRRWLRRQLEWLRPEVQAFVSAYKAKYKGKVPDAMAILSYDAMKLLADAITRQGELMAQLIKVLIESKPVVNVTVPVPEVHVEAPARDKRRLTITHSDGEESTVTEE